MNLIIILLQPIEGIVLFYSNVRSEVIRQRPLFLNHVLNFKIYQWYIICADFECQLAAGLQKWSPASKVFLVSNHGQCKIFRYCVWWVKMIEMLSWIKRKGTKNEPISLFCKCYLWATFPVFLSCICRVPSSLQMTASCIQIEGYVGFLLSKYSSLLMVNNDQV